MKDDYHGKCCSCSTETTLVLGRWCWKCFRRHDLDTLRDDHWLTHHREYVPPLVVETTKGTPPKPGTIVECADGKPRAYGDTLPKRIDPQPRR